MSHRWRLLLPSAIYMNQLFYCLGDIFMEPPAHQCAGRYGLLQGYGLPQRNPARIAAHESYLLLEKYDRGQVLAA